MRKPCTTNWSLFPPQTTEVQFDEKWSFVAKKEQNCDPDDPLDALKGDDWSHTAVDPEHALLMSLVPGKRTGETCQEVVDDVRQRTGGRTDLLLTSDEHSPYMTAIEKAYAVEVPRPKKPGPGRPPKPDRVMPEGHCPEFDTGMSNSTLSKPLTPWPILDLRAA